MTESKKRSKVKKLHEIEGMGRTESVGLLKLSGQFRRSKDPDIARIGRNLRTRGCGTCTVCCTILSVPETTQAHETCEKLCEGRCSIYQDRPKKCRDYICAWRGGYGPWEARPDRCGAIVDADQLDDGGIAAAVRFEGPFQSEPVFKVLEDMARVGFERAGFVDPTTEHGEPYALFDEPAGPLWYAANTGRAPWNGHEDLTNEKMGELLREELGEGDDES